MHPPAGPVRRVALRPVERADLPFLYEMQRDAEANSLAAVIPRDRAAFDAVWERSWADPAVTGRAIIADGELVGSIACFVMEGRPAVGYWIARAHWGRGIATSAVRLLLAEVPTRPMHASVARQNAPSLRVLLKCGFEVVGARQSPGTERYLPCEEVLLVLK